MELNNDTLTYATCGIRQGKMFITNITHYFFNEDIFANYYLLEDGIWMWKILNKYDGYDFYYLPEKASRIRELCEIRLQQILQSKILDHKKLILQYKELLTKIPELESIDFDWENRDITL
jgi:hypothetical protein